MPAENAVSLIPEKNSSKATSVEIVIPLFFDCIPQKSVFKKKMAITWNQFLNYHLIRIRIIIEWQKI